MLDCKSNQSRRTKSMAGRLPNSDEMHFTDPRLEVEEFNADAIKWDGLSINVYNQFRDALRGKNLIVEAVPGGRWCGLEIYYFDQFKLDGLTVPTMFKYQRPLLPSNQADSELVLKCAVAAAESEIECKEDSKRWFSFIESLTAAQNDPKTKLAALASGKAQTQPFKVRSFAGRYGSHTLVPPKEWFPESVQNLDPYRLLSIMPETEAELFLLNIGRIAVGCSEGIISEGVVKHDYRYFVGLVGDASIGKSDLVNRIKSALEKLGYSLAAWNTRKDNPFGWAKPAMADAVFHMDCATDDTANLVQNPILKAWMAGDSFLDNTKGGADVLIQKPNSGGLVFLANGLNIAKLTMSDDVGVTDRFLPLSCYELAELKDMYGVEPGSDDETALRGMTGFMWDALGHELGVSSDVLAAWLIRSAVDKFIGLAGYQVGREGALRKAGRSNIKRFIGEKRLLLRYNFGLNTKKDVTDSIANCIAYFISEQKRPDNYLKLLPNMELNYKLLASVVGYTVEPGSVQTPEALKCLRMQQLAPVTTSEFFVSAQRRIKVLAETSTPLEAFKSITQLLRAKGDGFGYPSNPVAYASLWRGCVKRIPIKVKEFEAQAVDFDNSALISLKSKLQEIFSEMSKYST